MAAALELAGVDLDGNEELDGFGRGQREIRRERKASGHDAHDPVADAVELDRLREDAGIAAEAALPQSVAEDRHGGTARQVLLLREPAADHGPRAQNVEEVGRALADADPDRLTATAGQVGGPEVESGDALETPDAAPVVEELGIRHPRLVEVLPAAPDHDPPLGLPVGQRREQDRADDREDGGRRAHAERQGQHGGRREARRPAHPPQGIPDVLEKVLHEVPPPPSYEGDRGWLRSAPD